MRFRNFHMRQLHIHFLFVVKYQTYIERLALLTYNTNIIAYLHYGLRTFTKKPNLILFSLIDCHLFGSKVGSFTTAL